jgi:hypothetical protein
LVQCERGRHHEQHVTATLSGAAALSFETEVRHMMVHNWTPKALQQLQHAVTQVDYDSLFAYYGYRVGVLNGGCWLIAKAIQQVTGGVLYYVEGNVDAAYVVDVVHTVVKLGDDTFIDGRGLHTSAQLLARWSHLEHEQQTHLSLEPLFFFPNTLERNWEVSAAIAWTITQQLLTQDAASAGPSENWLAYAINDEDDPTVSRRPFAADMDLTSFF